MTKKDEKFDNKEVVRDDDARDGADRSSIGEQESKGASRRRFVKGALGAAPVILTVTSRPVWANCTGSGMMSGNLSDGQEVCEGEGCAVSFYADHPERMNRRFPANAYFNQTFGINAFTQDQQFINILQDHCTYSLADNIIPNPTLVTADEDLQNAIASYQICGMQLAAEAIAALQNAANDVAFEMLPSEVIELFQQAFRNAYASAMAGSYDAGKMELERIADFLMGMNGRGSPYCRVSFRYCQSAVQPAQQSTGADRRQSIIDSLKGGGSPQQPSSGSPADTRRSIIRNLTK